MEGDSDRDLMARIADGDGDAMDTLYSRHAAVVFTVVLRVVRERSVAEDLLQEAFFRTWQHANGFDAERGNVRTWVVRIGHNLALNELRRQRSRPRLHHRSDDDEEPDQILKVADPSPGPAEMALAADRRSDVNQALHQLSDEQRSVLLLYAAGFSQTEIADRTDAPLGTVKSRMRLGLRHLRNLLKAEDSKHD